MTTSIGSSVHGLSLCIPELGPRKRDTVFQELAAHAQRSGVVRDAALLHQTLCLRERLGSTCIGKGVALPNARSIAVIEPRLIVARSRRGIDWKAADGAVVQLVLAVLSPAEQTVDAHHDLLARAFAAVRLQKHRTRLLEAPDAAAMAALMRELEA